MIDVLNGFFKIENYNSLVFQLLKNWHKGHFGKCNGISYKQLNFKR